jgi:hypothetical protein
MLAAALLVVVTGLLVFLVYSLLNVAFKPQDAKKDTLSSQKIPYKASFEEVQSPESEERMANTPNHEALQKASEVAAQSQMVEPEAEIQESTNEAPAQALTQPEVAGQTPEELNAPEPLQEKVSLKTESHSALDPYEKNENVALFGSNLRHPEATIEKTSGNFGGLENEIVAGVANQVSKPTDLDKVQFAAEMAQNGGEFMNGIFAYDSSEGGSYFSSL